MGFVAEKWTTLTGNEACVMDRLKTAKPLFWESKADTGSEELLQAYSTSIDAHKGGLMFSVVGGKLSEGINFSDSLGRAVVMVGLPFPNIHTAEWEAKLEYIEESRFTQLKQESSSKGFISDYDAGAKAKAAARAFYENVCMRAVNQCIGRAIRHREDYAAIYLIDRRYESVKIQEKLPVWLRQSIGSPPSSSDVFIETKRFFAAKAD